MSSAKFSKQVREKYFVDLNNYYSDLETGINLSQV